MALKKKKRVGKRTIAANLVRRTPSGRRHRKADGTQPAHKIFPDTATTAS